MSNIHEAKFDNYCSKCEHAKEDEFDVKSTCYDCLEQGWNIDSRKPVGFKEAKHHDKQRNR